MALWLAGEPLVLASRSKARQAMLAAAGVPTEVWPADLDERRLEAGARSQTPREIAAHLAREKALAVAKSKPARLTLGADQTLALDAACLAKPADRAAARAQLHALSGRSHELLSAVAVVQHGAVLAMRVLSDQFIELYLDAAGSAATASVGAYQIEGLGSQLFERVDGDYFTVLGLPLMETLDFLRRRGCLAQ
jgi:nucleoside triphosphate pyrophosphatase